MTSLRQQYCQECNSRGLVPNSGLVNMLPNDESLIPSLSVLHFGRNILGERGLSPLLAVIVKATSLHTLSLRDNGIGNEAVKELCRVLRHHPSLKVLELSGNPFTYLAAKHLVHLYEDNDSLSFIGMDDTLMTDRFKSFIHRRMQQALDRKTARRGDSRDGESEGQTVSAAAAAALPAALRGSARRAPDAVASGPDAEGPTRPPLAPQAAPAAETESTESHRWTEEGDGEGKDLGGTGEAREDFALKSPSDAPLYVNQTGELCVDDRESSEMWAGNQEKDAPAFLNGNNGVGQEVPSPDENITDMAIPINDNDTGNLSGKQVEIHDDGCQSSEKIAEIENPGTLAVESEINADEIKKNEVPESSTDNYYEMSKSPDNEDANANELEVNSSDAKNDATSEESLREASSHASSPIAKEAPKENVFLDMLFGD